MSGIFSNRLQKEYNLICAINGETRKFDLTKYFTEILIETRHDNFIPDLQLLNPKTGEIIYIEIAVTHSSSIEKLNSGYRIIEFTLESEGDAKELMGFKNGGANHLVDYYNFKEKDEIKEFCTTGNCTQQFNYFSVYDNGKSVLKVIKEKDIKSTLNTFNSHSIYHILEPRNLTIDEEDFYNENDISRKNFLGYLARAFQEKIMVKNCYICRYHAKNSPRWFVEGEPIFCKFQKITCGSNDASTCKYFKAEKKYIDAYLALDKAD